MADRQEFRGRVDFKTNVKSKFLTHTEPVEVTLAVDGGSQNADATFTQPANTVLTKCTIVCTAAPTIASGDIGYDVGTSAGGGQIIAAQADEILDAGTTVVLGAVTYPGLASGVEAATNGLVFVTQDAGTHAISPAFTAAARTVHCRITSSSECTTAGKFVFLWEWIQLADA